MITFSQYQELQSDFLYYLMQVCSAQLTKEDIANTLTPYGCNKEGLPFVIDRMVSEYPAIAIYSNNQRATENELFEFITRFTASYGICSSGWISEPLTFKKFSSEEKSSDSSFSDSQNSVRETNEFTQGNGQRIIQELAQFCEGRLKGALTQIELNEPLMDLVSKYGLEVYLTEQYELEPRPQYVNITCR